MTDPGREKLVLSVFPGIGLLDKGFERVGYCVVRGPDLLWGGDIRNFFPPSGIFAGVVGGSPCQDFSKVRRAPPTGYGKEMLAEFCRVVIETAPDWFLLENVPTVPSVTVPGYSVQRIDLNARDCGMAQNRLRHFQFGSVNELRATCDRTPHTLPVEPAVLASEGRRGGGRSFQKICALQGLPPDFSLPDVTRRGAYKMVGNGVPLPMAIVIALAVKNARPLTECFGLCACGCGRRLTGRQKCASAGCRKRLQMQRSVKDRAAD